MTRPYREACPNCGEDLDWHSVDVGIGIMCSPAWCDYCHYQEDNPYGLDDERGYPPASQRTDQQPNIPAFVGIGGLDGEVDQGSRDPAT